MKKIEAIIREESFENVKAALEEQSYFGMTVSEVIGRGRQKAIPVQRRAGEYWVDLMPKVKIEIVVLDDDVSIAVDSIISNSRTGEVVDGKIFILPVEGVVRIRTGDRDENAI